MASQAILKLEKRIRQLECRVRWLEQGLVKAEDVVQPPVEDFKGLSTTNLIPERPPHASPNPINLKSELEKPDGKENKKPVVPQPA